MPKVTLWPRGLAPLTVDLEWQAGSDDLSGFTLTHEGQSLTGAARFGMDGEGILRIGDRALPFHAVRTAGELHLWLDGETYVFEIPSPTQATRQRGQSLPVSGEVVSPMPGLVLKVLAQPGETVAAQAPLVVIESMKMELTVSAPANSRVVEVLSEPGQRVDRGAVLLRLEAAETRTGE